MVLLPEKEEEWASDFLHADKEADAKTAVAVIKAHIVILLFWLTLPLLSGFVFQYFYYNTGCV